MVIKKQNFEARIINMLIKSLRNVETHLIEN